MTAANNPAHDYSMCDSEALLSISTCIMQKMLAAAMPSSSPMTLSTTSVGSNKHGLPDDQSLSHRKKPCTSNSMMCFQCGCTGHLPASCTASTTLAQKPCAALVPNTSSANALQGPDGQQFCFLWSKNSQCTQGSSCNFSHSCTLCCQSNHGATECPSHQ
ncbi:hypothetical protein P691DRAFT_498277 [Macrolepiota fuliginosa MF-IS2]|uniref:CCHC-type domain-containing protein n=1 Tax=Macrolepiota fuliginosa MF-IS2 TaxID=1400762 RepID=A0A9P5X1I5_9AGAR|nr:hypothetical protein P691DRAFT_498277 [Macrolepiota fuliginosa MF-IS2]